MNIAKNLMELFVLNEAIIGQTKTVLPLSKLKVLCLLYLFGSLPAKIIASKTGILKSNIAFICKELLTENLIHSRKNLNDKRSIIYKITTDGEKILKNFLQDINKIFENVEADSIFCNSMQYVSKILNRKV